MRPSNFTDEQIAQALSQVTAGAPLATMCRKLGITPTTFYRWRKKLGAGSTSQSHELRALRIENKGLKQLVADLSLESQFLRSSRANLPKGARRTRARD